MYIIGGAQLKFVYMLVDLFFFFCRGHGPPKGQRGSAPEYLGEKFCACNKVV